MVRVRSAAGREDVERSAAELSQLSTVKTEVNVLDAANPVTCLE